MRLEAAFLVIAAAGCILYAAGCVNGNPTKEPRPYIAQRESDGLWIYRIDANNGQVLHECCSPFASDKEALTGFDLFRSYLESGAEPIIRTDADGRERWHIEDGQGGTVDNAEQSFNGQAAARKNFETVKRAMLAHDDPLMRYDVKL